MSRITRFCMLICTKGKDKLGQKDKKTEGQKDRKTKRQKDNTQDTGGFHKNSNKQDDIR